MATRIGRLEHELSFNNHEQMLLLPVAPDEAPVITPSNNENWNTTDVGMFKAIGHTGLKQTKVEGWFPNPKRNYPFCTYKTYPTPEACVEMINKWQESMRPIRYIITSADGDYLNEAFAIESFQHHKQQGTGDIYFELTLEEYKFAQADQVANIAEKDEMFVIVTLEEGQTLCELAEEWLGDSDRYKEIAELNGIEDVGHPWGATEDNHHQIQINCEEGTVGYDKLKADAEEGKGFG